MKAKWLPVSLIILPYPCLAVTAWLFAWQGTLDGSLLPLAALAAAGTVPNSAYALWLSARPQAETELLTWARRVKLGHVPLYLLSLALCIALAVTVVGLLVVPVVLVAMYAALLPASLYALAALRLARERGGPEEDLSDERRTRLVQRWDFSEDEDPKAEDEQDAGRRKGSGGESGQREDGRRKEGQPEGSPGKAGRDEERSREGGRQRKRDWQAYVEDMNASCGGKNPLIGREEELERTIQILCRKEKN